MNRPSQICLMALLSACTLCAAEPSFEGIVRPFVAQNCYLCHNEKLSSGGLNLKKFQDESSFIASRDQWEMVLQKLSAGEMPPKGMPRPPADQISQVTAWLRADFDRQDRSAPVDPGHVTARRLNRYEYNNSIRDLLAVDFRPADDFPVDDFGYGFDNIGDVLTLSPALLEKYLDAAQNIAKRAIEPEAPPKRPVVYEFKNTGFRREIAWQRKFSWEADYDIRIAVGGRRDPGELFVSFDQGTPEKFALSMEGNEFQHFDLRKHLTYGKHELKAWIVRDDEFTIEHAWTQEQKRGAELKALAAAGKPLPPGYLSRPVANSKDEIRAMLLNGTLIDGNGSNTPVHPEFLQVLGPYEPKPAPLPDGYKLIFVCGHAPGHHAAQCARIDLANFARRAWRRPVSNAEVNKLVSYVRMAQRDGAPFEDAMRQGVAATLVSPWFLFRVEREPATPGIHRIGDFELATRLSYFLWSSTPDEELYKCAEEGKLHDPPVLAGQVMRMMHDPKSAALVDNFGGQWLETRNLDSMKPDPDKFPQFTADVRDSMKEETRLFFDYIMRQDRSILEFLTAKYTFLNETLANFYGIPGVNGDEFRKVDLTGTPRTGIITQGSVLTVSSYPTRTSPVVRGKWILENILNAPPPPPPANVPSLDDAGIGASMTLREQMEKHRANPVCASCHSKMDPLGFGLENFDAIGRWRTHDGKFPIDSKGTLPDGRTFSTPDQLVGLIAGNKEAFTRCVTEKMLTFALGRGLESYDRPALSEITRNVAEQDYRFSALILQIVRSAPFQMERGEGNEAKPELSASAKKGGS